MGNNNLSSSTRTVTDSGNTEVARNALELRLSYFVTVKYHIPPVPVYKTSKCVYQEDYCLLPTLTQDFTIQRYYKLAVSEP